MNDFVPECLEHIVCRICVEEKAETKLISDAYIEYENDKLSIQCVLRNIAGEKITNVICNDTSLIHICTCCIESALNSYRFKKLCENSTDKFETYSCSFNFAKKNKIIVTEEKEIEDLKLDECDDYSEDDIPLINFTNDEFLNDSEDKEKIEHVDLFEEICNKVNNQKIKTKRGRKKNNIENIVDENLDNEIVTCKICNKLFKSKYILLAHEKRHENKGKFICNECGKGFDSKGCLTRHIRVHTGEKKFQCGECLRYFPSANNLRLHSRRHNGIKPYLCTQCGKSFSHPTGLSYHLRTHTRERPYTCEICGKSFLIQCHLDRHKKTHTGERPFACTQCKRAFIKKIDLQRHEAIHSGERPHVCKICNKSFLRILHLNYHMMVHTAERPHRCKYCGKGFIRRYYLTDHIKKRHSEDIPLDSGNTVLE